MALVAHKTSSFVKARALGLWVHAPPMIPRAFLDLIPGCAIVLHRRIAA
jgi:hypothetical protein